MALLALSYFHHPLTRYQYFSNPLTNLNLFPFIDFSHRLNFVFVTKQTTDLDVDIALILMFFGGPS